MRYNYDKKRTEERVSSAKPAGGAHASRSVKQKKTRFSAMFVGVAVAVSLIVGFAAGTRGAEVLTLVGAPFGVEVSTKTLDLSSLQETYRKLDSRYDGKLDTKELVEYANKGMVQATGDEYTQYFTASEAEKLRDDLAGNIGGGIGAEIGLRNSQPTIIRPLKDSPAAQAGLKAGDIVLAVNDSSVRDKTVDEVVQKIRGEIGTTVKLAVERDSEMQEVSITRAEIISPDVESEVVGGVGVITVSRFDKETARKVRAAADDFVRKDLKGVVLDLRGNGGGYLEAGIDVASVWLDNKVVVSERRGEQVIGEKKSAKRPVLQDMPTVVLINAGSASASEIVAGALHDHGRAQLVGEKTYGKGSVQELVSLSNGAELKVTIAKWYTPKGKNITKQGIEPDQEVELTPEDIEADRDPQREAAVKLLK